MDGFLKNVGSSAESIRMKANVMGDAPASEMEWNEPFFRDCFDKVAKMITFVSRKQKPFARLEFFFLFYLQYYFYILSSHFCLYFICRTR
jgi:hypothetical protein